MERTGRRPRRRIVWDKPVTGVSEVLDFWLGEVGPTGWYAVDGELDALCRSRFGGMAEEAREGTLWHWQAGPRSVLALLILLDQIPRNARRGTPGAFAGDARARAVAKAAIRRGLDLGVGEPERQFFYLPLMHSESLADQERCVRLVLMRLPESGEDNLKHAVLHRDVIRRFGRFPSRNRILARPDTPAERAYREAGGYMS